MTERVWHSASATSRSTGNGELFGPAKNPALTSLSGTFTSVPSTAHTRRPRHRLPGPPIGPASWEKIRHITPGPTRWRASLTDVDATLRHPARPATSCGMPAASSRRHARIP